MPRGGPRPGGGRPKGSKTKRTVLKEEAVANGLDPADVLQELLDKYHAAKDWERVRAVANDLMPYRHHKLATLHMSADVHHTATNVVEFLVTTREQADAAIAALAGTNGVPRQ